MTVRQAGRSSLEKWMRPLLAAFAAWIFFVDLVRLSTELPFRDEIEHAHAAWLLAHGHRPYVDFFEHHLPGLWQLLAVWGAVFPKDGAEILYWGRFLCAVSLAVCSWLVYKIAARDRSREAGWLAVILWLVVALPCSAASIRPEMPACPLLLASLYCLLKSIESPNERRFLLLSGLFSGSAAYFTPRAVFWTAGLFLSQVRRLSGNERLTRLSCAAVGPALAVSWIGWPDFSRWIVDFNRYFGAVGPRFRAVESTGLGGVLAALLVPVLHAFWRKDRGTIELGIIYALAMVPGLMLERAPYLQGFACAMPLAVILLARHMSVLLELSPRLRSLALLELALFWFWPCGLGRGALSLPRHFDLARDVRQRVGRRNSARFEPCPCPGFWYLESWPKSQLSPGIVAKKVRDRGYQIPTHDEMAKVTVFLRPSPSLPETLNGLTEPATPFLFLVQTAQLAGKRREATCAAPLSAPTFT